MTFERIEREAQNLAGGAVNTQSLHVRIRVYGLLNDVAILANSVAPYVRIGCDLLEISILGCDCFEGYGDPFAAQVSAPKHDIFEF